MVILGLQYFHLHICSPVHSPSSFSNKDKNLQSARSKVDKDDGDVDRKEDP